MRSWMSLSGFFDVAEAAEWLEKNVPNYREIVENVLGRLRRN